MQIRHFTDLNAWKEAHILVLLVYKSIKDLPKFEQYALADQIRRAVVSISSNIAEGFSRRSTKEKLQFYSMAKGSLTELENLIYVARDVEYITKETSINILMQINDVGRLITGLSRSAENI
jgi:four helix bundle protein